MQNKLFNVLKHQTEIWNQWAPTSVKLSPEGEASRLAVFWDFLKDNPHAADRAHVPGHLTGSALVIDPTFSMVLLTHHRKLGLWLQLGGHADGDWDLGNVAIREVIEESGLVEFKKVQFRQPTLCSKFIPFDLDCHTIPANPKDECHKHYDVRFLIVADPNARVVISDESHDVRWFTWNEARSLTSEVSMHRQFDKVEILKSFPQEIELVPI